MTKILFFGPLKDVMGVKEIIVGFDDVPLLRSDIVDLLSNGNSDIIEALNTSSVRIIADNKIVADDFDLSGAHEVAFLPPMSGG